MTEENLSKAIKITRRISDPPPANMKRNTTHQLIYWLRGYIDRKLYCPDLRKIGVKDEWRIQNDMCILRCRDNKNR